MKTKTIVNEFSGAPARGREHDFTQIRQVIADAERFQNDPDKFVQLLTSDVHLVNVVGYRVTGRDELHSIMGDAVKTSLSEITTRHELHEIEFLSDNVALVICTKYISTGNPVKVDMKAALTFVMVQNGGEWFIASAQNTLIQERAVKNIREQKIESAGKHLSDLKR